VAEQSTLGHFVLKNTLDIPDDTVLFDPINDNPISFFKNVLASRSTPNSFRTRKRFYGRFITQLYADGSAGKSGNGLWDDVITSFKIAGAESTQEMKLFVAIVHVPELQSYKFPAKEDWDTIHKVATNGGTFKSYVYSGEIPKYGDNVLVSFNDPATRSEGIFLHPLVGGASAGWDDSGDDQDSLRQQYENCSNSPPLLASLTAIGKSVVAAPASAIADTAGGDTQKAETLKAAENGATPDVDQQRPAKPCVSFDGPPSQPFTGPGSLQWVKIQGNDRVHLRFFSGKVRKQHGTRKMQHYLSGLKTVPAGNKVSSQKGMSSFKPGWYIGDVSRIKPMKPTPGHKSHQSGIDVDMSIPMNQGKMNILPSGKIWRFKNVDVADLDIEMNLLFLKYTAPHASAAFLDQSLINALKNAAKVKSDAGTGGWNEELFKVIFGPSRHGGFYIHHVSGHRNHYHIRLKPPGLYDKKAPFGKLDEV
jgi:hypothetical protein